MADASDIDRDPAGGPPILVRAAQYVRMSTEHQNYSIEGQTVANAAYAIRKNLQIVRTYADAGISGIVFPTKGCRAI